MNNPMSYVCLAFLGFVALGVFLLLVLTRIAENIPWSFWNDTTPPLPLYEDSGEEYGFRIDSYSDWF